MNGATGDLPKIFGPIGFKTEITLRIRPVWGHMNIRLPNKVTPKIK